MARNFFRNIERTQENLDRRVWTRELGENGTWYDRITIFAQAAKATDIEQAKLRHLPLCLFRDQAPPLLEIDA